MNLCAWFLFSSVCHVVCSGRVVYQGVFAWTGMGACLAAWLACRGIDGFSHTFVLHGLPRDGSLPESPFRKAMFSNEPPTVLCPVRGVVLGVAWACALGVSH